MKSLDLPVRERVLAHLKTHESTSAIFSDRWYDDPTSDPVWPFGRYGVPISSGWEATCLDGSQHRITLHGFDKGPGTDGAMRGAQAIVDAMADLSFDDLSVIDLQWTGTNIIADPTTRGAHHAIVQFQITVAEYAP